MPDLQTDAHSSASLRRPAVLATTSACGASDRRGSGPAPETEPAGAPHVGFRGAVRLWWGKLRRAFLGRLLPGYVRRRHALRRGHCVRCGACCQLGIVCPALDADAAGLAICLKYQKKRDPNCRIFPITQSDLRDRDLILPGTPCGYWFPDEADRPSASRRPARKR